METISTGLKVIIDRLTYHPGKELEIHIDLSGQEDLSNDLTYITINIYRIEARRNQFAFVFGHRPVSGGRLIRFKQMLPDALVEGLYRLNRLTLCYDRERRKEIHLYPGQHFQEVIFWYSNDRHFMADEKFLRNKIDQLKKERHEFINAEITHPLCLSKNPDIKVRTFKVLIFSVGCLLHSPQNMRGYTIYPLPRGFSYSHLRTAVNYFLNLKYGFHLAPVQEIEQSFRNSTPLFVIEFHNVKAPRPEQALELCTIISENIFTILAYKKGSRPQRFASVIIDPLLQEKWQEFNFPGYRGNLVSEFSASSLGEAIEKILFKMEKSPWIELLIRLYSEAQTEMNPCVACLRFWSILEMISEKRVTNNNLSLYYPNGQPIKDHGGTIVTTKYALGKVYKHVLECKIPPSHVTDVQGGEYIFETHEDIKSGVNVHSKARVMRLWETLSALYEVRNQVAHSGVFDWQAARNSNRTRAVLASQLWELPHAIFVSQVDQMTRTVVEKELNRT